MILQASVKQRQEKRPSLYLNEDSSSEVQKARHKGSLGLYADAGRKGVEKPGACLVCWMPVFELLY